MNEEKQRISIAEACGMRLFEMGPDDQQWLKPKLDGGVDQVALPDYLNDLNAMHEAEMPLGEFESTVYYDTLIYITGSQRAATFATASQRAEAFLKTIGKWEDEK